MREDLAKLVYPVLAHGLRLKERLERGEPASLATEQSALKTLLLSDAEARRWPDFGGDDGRVHAEHFLGIRYALACWLDEIFLTATPWSKPWNDARLEEALYRSNDRASRFWEQAALAEKRPSADALEAFYLCVMLGFRGERRDQPEPLAAWAETVGKRLSREQYPEWVPPPEIDPPPFSAPPLLGEDRLRRCGFWMMLFLVIVLPMLIYFFVTRS
jgi:type VI secretion system protein ImpK